MRLRVLLPLFALPATAALDDSSCRDCPVGLKPAWCTILVPPDGGEPLTVTICPGEPPIAALDLACMMAPEDVCSAERRPALARDLLARTIGVGHRRALAQVAQWLPPKDRFYGRIPVAGNINYGVNTEAEEVIDAPVSSSTSYSDLLGWILCGLSAYGSPRYLEIGVSVGKTLHQLSWTAATHHRLSSGAEGASPARGATLTGLDIEPFNPRLLGLHPPVRTLHEWPSPFESVPEAETDQSEKTPPRSLKTDGPSSASEYLCGISGGGGGGGGTISGGGATRGVGDPAVVSPASLNGGCSLYYVSADLKTDDAWEVLATHVPGSTRGVMGGGGGGGGEGGGGGGGGRGRSEGGGGGGGDPGGFELIFSDAWHSAAAIRWELSQLVQRRLLTEQTVIVWDDVSTPGMQRAFGENCIGLRRFHPAVLRDAAAGGLVAPRIDCFLSAVAPGWLASNRSNLIGIAGPASVLEAIGLHLVLPSRLHLEDFGFALE